MGPLCELIRICYKKNCKNICEYGITFKRINNII